MFGLFWFDGIGWDTKLRDIGWVYVILGILVLVVIVLLKRFIADLKGGFDDEW